MSMLAHGHWECSLKRINFIITTTLFGLAVMFAGMDWWGVLDEYPWKLTISTGAAMLVISLASTLRDVTRANARSTARISEIVSLLKKATRQRSDHSRSLRAEIRSAYDDASREFNTVTSGLETRLRQALIHTSEETSGVLAGRIRELDRDQATRLDAAVERLEHDQATRLDAAVRRLEREQELSYRQTEATTSLLATQGLHVPLPQLRGTWSIAPDSAAFLLRLIYETRPEVILELGSGLSTVLVARAIDKMGKGRLISLDHDEHYARETRAMLASHGLGTRAEVIVAPLKQYTIDDESWEWYDLGQVPNLGRIDFLVVDGPPGTTGPLARYPAVPLLREFLGLNSLVFLDDASRADEKAIIDRWLEDDGFEPLPVPPLEKGGALLRRIAKDSLDGSVAEPHEEATVGSTSIHDPNSI